MTRESLVKLGYKYEVGHWTLRGKYTFLKAFKRWPSQKSIERIAVKWNCELDRLNVQTINI